jgi:hypothetical protein
MSGPGLYVEPIRLLARETQVLQMDWTRNRAGCGSMLWITKKKNPTGRGVERKKEMERLLSSFLVYLPYRLPKLGDTHKERDEFGVVDFLSSRFVLYRSETGHTDCAVECHSEIKKGMRVFLFFHIRLIESHAQTAIHIDTPGNCMRHI